MSRVLTDDFSTEPFWVTGLPSFQASHTWNDKRADTLIVGAGYAGLSAALTLARAGQRVLVCDAGRVGSGASSSSAGSLGNVPKAKFDDLLQHYGENVARRVYQEARLAREYVEQLIQQQGIACDLRCEGRFIAAHSAKAFTRLRNTLPALRAAWGDVTLVDRSEQQSQIGSNAFFGGVRLADSSTLQPAGLHMGLAQAADAAGAVILQETRVTAIEPAPQGYTVTAGGRTFEAKEVILATNAETGRDTPHTRRLRKGLTIVPAFALTTEPLSDALLANVLPQGGSFSNTCKIIHYMAIAGGSRRLVMSGRAGRSDGGLEHKAEYIFDYFRQRFPALSEARVSHCWSGRFAITGDWLPHIGQQNGVHYVLGCCGAGIPMSTYLGHKVALRILGSPEGVTVFNRPLKSIPYWPANNLFLPMAVRAFDWRDRWFH